MEELERAELERRSLRRLAIQGHDRKMKEYFGEYVLWELAIYRYGGIVEGPEGSDKSLLLVHSREDPFLDLGGATEMAETGSILWEQLEVGKRHRVRDQPSWRHGHVEH